MVNGWRRVFCTSIPKEREPKIITEDCNSGANTAANNTRSPRLGLASKFAFFTSTSTSNPSTPRNNTVSVSTPSASGAGVVHVESHGLKCKTNTAATATGTATTITTTTPVLKSPRFFSSSSSGGTPTTPSSPRSPSTFSLLLKTSLRLSRPSSRCGICALSVKSGQGTAIFTAECSHSFHFPCVSSLAASGKNGVVICCPVCGCQWKEAPVIGVPKICTTASSRKSPLSSSTSECSSIRMYDDDEPLISPVSGIRFNPIPETEDESEDGGDSVDIEFPGFFSDPSTPRPQLNDTRKNLQISISPDAAVVAVGRSYETYAVLLNITAPPSPAERRRPSVDVVAVVDIGGEMTPAKLHALKKAMRLVISSLSSHDRLSIVAYSANSKRLLPLRRMTTSGRRSARRIIDTLNLSNGSCVNDALRKGAKVIQDRKEKNHFSTIILFDGHDSATRSDLDRRFDHVSSTRFSHLEIPVHTFKVGEEFAEEMFLRSVNKFLSVVVLDVRVQVGFGSGSAAAQIAAIYSCTGRPGLLNPGSAKIGDLYSEEEREILMEFKVPASSIGLQKLLSVRSYFKDPSSSMKQVIYGGNKSLIVPRPHTIRSSDPSIQRLRGLFVMTRAVAESRRLLGEKNDLVGAERLLISARAVLGQPSFKVQATEEFRKRVEAELAEVRWRRQSEPEEKRKRDKDCVSNGGGVRCCIVDEKGEPLTPTSAWKAAERLAKVAVMRKSQNRVSDLHGFEDARF